ncbi:MULTISPECIES: heme exporter protein CcmD [Nitrincola]|uniref:Heme exporter protein D n=2 Tax=Nitrincola TaxID=267849 RepID=A0A364NHZ1_9GAMM|nr:MULTISPECIES: heme exporter protein CcmD [Nitrincola]EXJ12189.1 heme exporter protein CcmD [Nitrincola nitratireducens]RAU16692.1 heme exporter protein CcmD [Nitrincola tibetensis]
MSFDSFSEFLAMGGHGLYVWSSYALGLAVMLGCVLSPILTRKRLITEQQRRLRREEETSS